MRNAPPQIVIRNSKKYRPVLDISKDVLALPRTALAAVISHELTHVIIAYNNNAYSYIVPPARAEIRSAVETNVLALAQKAYPQAQPAAIMAAIKSEDGVRNNKASEIIADQLGQIWDPDSNLTQALMLLDEDLQKILIKTIREDQRNPTLRAFIDTAMYDIGDDEHPPAALRIKLINQFIAKRVGQGCLPHGPH